MNNKYNINSDSFNSDIKQKNECGFVYSFLYIIIIFCVILLIYKFIFNYEYFEINNDLSSNSPSYGVLLDKINTFKQNTEISQKFNKIDENSMNDIINKFKNELICCSNDIPSIDNSKGIFISDINELSELIDKTSSFKNIYKPGEIVDSNSSFTIDKNKICFKSENKLSNLNPEIKNMFTGCIACSVQSEDYSNTPGWNNTKTNIKQVCLYGDNPDPLLGVPNLEQCKKLCSN